jgi:hypothetical protein
LLKYLGSVDFFLHDSLHSVWQMSWEFRMISPYLELAHPGVVVADDVEVNSAFKRWVDTAEPAFAATVAQAEKETLCGIAVMHCVTR